MLIILHNFQFAIGLLFAIKSFYSEIWVVRMHIWVEKNEVEVVWTVIGKSPKTDDYFKPFVQNNKPTSTIVTIVPVLHFWRAKCIRQQLLELRAVTVNATTVLKSLRQFLELSHKSSKFWELSSISSPASIPWKGEGRTTQAMISYIVEGIGKLVGSPFRDDANGVPGWVKFVAARKTSQYNRSHCDDDDGNYYEYNSFSCSN